MTTKATKQDGDDPEIDARAITPLTVAEQAWAGGEYVSPVVGTLPATGTATLTVTVTNLPANQAALALAMLSMEFSRDSGRIWFVMARAPWVTGVPLTQAISPFWAGALMQARLTVPVGCTCGLTVAAA